MTDSDRITQIRDRLQKASPGPWHWTPVATDGRWDDQGPNLVSTQKQEAWEAYWGPDGNGVGKDRDAIPPDPTVVGAWGHDAWGINVEEADADFIAHAPTDIAFLLAERDAMRKEIEGDGNG